MRTLLILSSLVVFASNAQDLTYFDRQIIYEGELLYQVHEIREGKELMEYDYLESDSSQYYDYMILDTNGNQVLYLRSIYHSERSDGFYPNRYASHALSRSNDGSSIILGTITENDLPIIANNKTYRSFLIEYLIQLGILTKNGVSREALKEFELYHR